MATTLMILTGLLTCFIGITGIIRGVFFNRVATYPFYYSVFSRGVTLLVIGAVALVVGLALLIRRHWARHVATVVAVISAIANFMFMPFYPFWSIVVLALNVLIIWELTRESGRRGYALLPCPARVVSGCAHLNGLSRLTDSGEVGRTIRCPYHAWTYGLDCFRCGAEEDDEDDESEPGDYPRGRPRCGAELIERMHRVQRCVQGRRRPGLLLLPLMMKIVGAGHGPMEVR